MASNSTYRPSNEALARYFAEESDAEEIVLIQTWVKSDVSNQEELELLRVVWMDVGSLNATPAEVDSAAAFQKVKSKKESFQKDTPSTFRTIWKVAAVLVLVASLIFLVLDQRKDATMELVAQQVGKVELSDGSQITVNTGSTLTYPKVFDNNLRKVQLSGEAFFNVSHNPSQPFVVQISDVTVTVLGTSFNIKEEDNSLNVSVVTGRVKVVSALGTELVTAGEQVTLQFDEQKLSKSTTSESGTEQYWFSKKLTFQGSTMASVIEDLEETYQVNIKPSNKNILNCRFQATFEDQTIEEVLEIIGISQGLKFEKIDDTYILTGEGCVD